MTEDEQFDIQMKNVVNNASWKLTDVLITTPIIMSHIIDQRDKFDPYDINPAVIVIDEFDELIQNENITKHLMKIFRKFASMHDENNVMAQTNRER